jgi:ribonuclease T1
VRFSGRPLALSAWRRAGLTAGLAFLLAGGALFAPGAADAFTDSSSTARGALQSGAVRWGELPPEARFTGELIRSGGPFPYQKDGTTFGNRERLLPLHPRGHYREYTVRTPASRDRGARRIVCGGNPPTRTDSCFYTDDHYASFRRIVQ